jgi:hypothetical protein
VDRIPLKQVVFDCAVFKSARFKEAKAFFEYQKQFLEAVCRDLTAEGF